MQREWFYVVGTDTTIKQNGKVKSVPCFDGPHDTPEIAHEQARTLIVAGSYEVLPFATPSRDVARQTWNHQLGVGGEGVKPLGAAKALENKFRLNPQAKTQKQVEKAENDAAWGR